MRIYLDNCCYNRPFDDQLQIRIALESQAKLYIQRLIVEKKIELVMSYVSRFENTANPHVTRRNAIDDFFRNAKFYVDYSFAADVEKIAKSIMRSGVKAKDALHIACAIEGRCDYLLTTDDRVLKYLSSQIKICNPIDFLRELEGTKDA
ncbi:MAG: PIN domain-containing protein [Synergistaceae bacterium]|jgi:predicted nucleic acid-binding protein|nr:PIN domain-containing protein [Synergistaceae bacterium]